MTDKRSSPFEDRRAKLSAVQTVNEAHGYGESPAPPVPPVIRGRGPFRTGRTAQLNLKADPDVVQRFSDLCARYRWVSGQTMQYAIEALEREIADGKVPPPGR